MGCLFALLAGIAPRVALVLLWIFTDMVDRAYATFLVPLFGLVILPYTTLFYALAYAPVIGVSTGGWFFVGLGVVFDIAHWAGGAFGRRR